MLVPKPIEVGILAHDGHKGVTRPLSCSRVIHGSHSIVMVFGWIIRPGLNQANAADKCKGKNQ